MNDLNFLGLSFFHLWLLELPVPEFYLLLYSYVEVMQYLIDVVFLFSLQLLICWLKC